MSQGLFLVMDRHIGREVLFAIVVVLAAFIGLMTLFALIEELREEEASYTLFEVMWYVLLTTPRRIYEVLPYVVFLGALVGLGNLANHSEIVVFRTSGVAASRVFLSVVYPAGLVLVCGFLVGELIAPRGEQLAEAHKTRTLQESDVIALKGGYWYREGKMVMYVDGLGGRDELIGVRQYWYDENKELNRALTAERAEFRAATGDQDGYWLLHNVVETQFDATSTVSQSLLSKRWEGQVDPRVLSVRVLVAPRKLSLWDLHYQIGYMNREGLNSTAYQLAFWGKVLQPLSVLGLSLLALAFVLGPLREVGMGVRLSFGILVGLSFKYLQDLLAPMSTVYELPPVLAVLLPILACWLLGVWALRRLS